MKSFIALTAATGLITSPVMAGPYANIESNSSWSGNDYSKSVVHAHGGYKGQVGENGTWAVEAGPALVSPDGEQEEVEFSGKAKASYQVAQDLKVYGEYKFLTGEEFGSSVKAGVTYNF